MVFSTVILNAYVEFQNPNPSNMDYFGHSVVVLTNGNVVITAPYADINSISNCGAVYLFDGTTHNLISTLYGTSDGDNVGYHGVISLSNGNFVVISGNWDNGAILNAGAVTWGSGTSGVSGAVSSSNSLVGSSAADQVGIAANGGVTALSNGNYVVIDKVWKNGTFSNAGAATWGSGTSGVSGTISSSNSLVGTKAEDAVGIGGIILLSNGNYVINSYSWDIDSVTANAGAVTWGSGTSGVSGAVSSSNSLVGSIANDNVGMTTANIPGVTALTNGNYVVSSSDWSNGGISYVGAATWCNGTTGRTGTISSSNSLVGTASYDCVAKNGVTALTNGNYVVNSRICTILGKGGAGAATWCNGTTGRTGAVSSSNSLYGTTNFDQIGVSGIVALANGNYVVISPYWNNGTVADAGAVTWCNGTTGTTGAVSISNSLVGTTQDDALGNTGASDFTARRYAVTALTNGNYVVRSPNWDNGMIINAGAVTWGSGTSGVSGAVSSSNSLVGSSVNDQVGLYLVTALTNGNYVVNNYIWDNGAIVNAGAVTWCNGTSGTTGAVSSSNSLVGSTANDYVGNVGVTALINGNYVVASSNWSNGAIANVGAATWGSGTSGVSGAVSSSNSLVGSTAYDNVGNVGVSALSNGNFVVSSKTWKNGAISAAGAATWGSGTSGVSGAVSSSNSLVGSTAYDNISDGGVSALSNGNFVVASTTWDHDGYYNSGAATLGNGTSGLSGTIDTINSVFMNIGSSFMKSVIVNNSTSEYYVSFNPTGAAGKVIIDSVNCPSVPVLTSTSASSITQTLASSGGAISSDGGYAITAKGVVWSTSASPTVALATKTNDGTGTSTFTSSLTGLTPNTTYYYRAYATTAAGTGYGADSSFSTLVSSAPTLGSTDAATNISNSAATSGGSITSDGGLSISAKGVVWSTSTNPTIALSTKTNDGTGTSTFTSSITGLTLSTTYYVKSYATNSMGTSYGNEISFTTLALPVPVLTTTASSSVTYNSASSGGAISSDGGETITSKGVVWGTSASPTVALSTKTDDGTGTATFSSSITGLAASTTYYYRAYATTINGTGYGAESSFTTLVLPVPVLTSTAASSITQTTASSGGAISSDAGYAVTAKGVVWSTSTSPTVALSTKTDDGTGTATFTSSLTGLTANTTYYYRAYATNSIGTAYGAESSFTTLALSSPTLGSTDAATNISNTAATSGGSITSDGGLSITAKGVVWSTSTNPTIALSTKTNDGTGTSTFTSSITGLTLSTTYYVKSYATNSMGTSYGNEISFTTINISNPTVSSVLATSITHNSASSGGSISSDGGAAVTAKGVVWGTSSSPTVALISKTNDGTGNSSFSSNIINLLSNTTYYVRAYATNIAGTSYGSEYSFTTWPAPRPADGSINLNFDQDANTWIDNNTDNTNASVPSNGGTPNGGDGTDPNFGDHPTWTFDGTNDCFQIPYNNNNNRLNNNSAKSLFIYFRTGTSVSSRQVLLELGGTNSGFNAYIYSGKVWVGMWNSTQRRYFSTSISTNTNYLVSAEFNGTKVRTSLNGYCSSSMLFSGFATNSNANGVGASINGTRYMDNTSSTGLSSFLNGTVAEILLYNSCDQSLRESLVDFIDTKYSKNFTANYTPYFGKVAAESNWTEYELEVSPFDNNDNLVSNLEVYKSQKDLMINLNLDESENIELAIFDLNGIKVGTISNVDLKKGINNFTYSTENLISGVYIVRAIGLNINESVKINIVK